MVEELQRLGLRPAVMIFTAQFGWLGNYQTQTAMVCLSSLMFPRLQCTRCAAAPTGRPLPAGLGCPLHAPARQPGAPGIHGTVCLAAILGSPVYFAQPGINFPAVEPLTFPQRLANTVLFSLVDWSVLGWLTARPLYSLIGGGAAFNQFMSQVR